MGLFDRLIPQLVQAHGIPHEAAKGAVALAARAHAGDPQAVARVRAASPQLQGIIGNAIRGLKKEPDFWTAHYITQAKQKPLPAHHPYAAHVHAALSRTPHARQLPPGPTHAAGAHGGHHGGGGHHHGGVAHVRQVRHDQAEAFGGPDWGGPFGLGADYLILDQQQMDQTAPAADNGGPEWDEAQHTPRGLFEGQR